MIRIIAAAFVMATGILVIADLIAWPTSDVSGLNFLRALGIAVLDVVAAFIVLLVLRNAWCRQKKRGNLP